MHQSLCLQSRVPSYAVAVVSVFITKVRIAKRFLVAVLVLVALTTVPGTPTHARVLASGVDGWGMPGHDVSGTRFNPAATTLTVSMIRSLHPVWTLPILTGPSPVVIGNLVFVPAFRAASGSKGVDVLDARTGKRIRRFSMTALHLPPGDVLSVLACARGIVVLGDTGDPYAHPVHPPALVGIDAKVGRRLWRVSIASTWLAIAGRTVYTGFDTSAAIDLLTGRVLWRHTGRYGSPLVLAGHLYQARRDGDSATTSIYDPRTGELVQTIANLPNTTWIGNSRHAFADHLQFGGQSWLASMTLSGQTSWKVDLGPIESTPLPALAYDTLFVASQRPWPGVLAMRASDGRVLWKAAIGPNVALAASGRLIFALHRIGPRSDPNLDTRVDVLEAGSGRLLRRINLSTYLQQHDLMSGLSDLAIAADTLYLFSYQGVVALRP